VSDVLVRITSPDEWAGGRIDDDGEGFVHLSAPHQVVLAANEHYRGRRDLELLVLDRARLGAIRVEGGFPHLYDALPSDAVTDVLAFPCDDDGTFQLALVSMFAGEPPASDLLAAMVADITGHYGEAVIGTTPSARPEELWKPGGSYLVGWDESGNAVCGGGFKHLTDDCAEIKRMYVEPAARSRGHARRLLVGLEDAARRAGYARVRLDTGPKQPHAQALYESAGYVEIDNYNDNPAASYFAEKLL